ncbi:carboxypeptidase family protein [Gillisia mitskevichiae]|uniref:Carboxypeptidase family protein n=1 Tax=Gillisia mitskevichiae TaxID=270921 RepID=A0A495NYM8_9FLAO|nr:carboxypeptidase-like regulatory domain-containing protein [Gillisia mitskevichiae]RKS42258.1 carboxypeptidase family protein [Gillisia mitskevichiae]
MKALLINLTLILFSQLINAQAEINGKIKSSITNEAPISYVYIVIKNINKPILERMTSTNKKGFFKIENLEIGKDYSLEISAPGYDKHIFEITPEKKITSITLTIDTKCDYSKEQAEIDWKNGEAKFLLVGSIAPIANTESDKKFEKEFNIKYFDFGCLPPTEECIKIYNQKLFELMDKKFGKIWRKNVRTDVEYL